MTYQGTVRGGVVVLEPGAHLPDGLSVTVQPASEQNRADSRQQSSISMRNGVPVFISNSPTVHPSLELVNKLRDDAP
jgi:hypothetical protein